MCQTKNIYLLISKNFKRIRKEIIKLTQDELAKEINMSRSFLAHFEKSDGSIGISIDTLYNIAFKYNFDIREFFKEYEKLDIKK